MTYLKLFKKRYVTFSPFQVFQDDFELISEAKSPFKISCVAYNDHQGEIVSAGQGHVLVSLFYFLTNPSCPLYNICKLEGLMV